MAVTTIDVRQLPTHGPVIPVITIAEVNQAVPLAKALLAGGVKVLEVTLRTDAALAAIEAIARDVPDAIVGAGTVVSASDAAACVNAGARFAVSPGLTTTLASACQNVGLPLLPGVATASEVMIAADAGFNFLKFFPAAPAGGTAMLKALAGPFGSTRFCPTGGISVDNALQYLNLPNVQCVGGSWLTPPDLLTSGDYEAITGLARQATALTERTAPS